MRYFLGIDVGGTKTHALLTDESGLMVGFGHTGPGNHEVVGYEGLVAALQDATQQAIQTAGIQKEQIAGAGFGIAGYDFPSERRPTLAAIASLGLTCPVEAVNDVVIGLIAGASQGWGIVVDAGTGCNVRGRDAHGKEGWVTGCGSTFRRIWRSRRHRPPGSASRGASMVQPRSLHRVIGYLHPTGRRA